MGLEKKNLEERFEASTTLANGNVVNHRALSCDMKRSPEELCVLPETFDHFKRTVLEEREYEARLRKYGRRLRAHLALSVFMPVVS